MEELKFLGFSDLEGRHDLIGLLVDADLSKFDFLLYKGDTPDPEVYKNIRKLRSLGGRPWEERTSTSIMEESEEVKNAFRKAVEDSTKINNLFSIIKKKIPIYGVLGNSDTVPTRIAPHLGLEPVNFNENIEMLHNKIIRVKGFNLIGYNGRVKYLDENIVEAPELMFDEDNAFKDLSKLFERVDPRRTIFVTHVPPYGILDKVKEDWVPYAVSTYGDKAKEGHIGSNAFRDAVIKYQPLIHTFGHVHETSGVEKQGGTTFINGGALGATAEVEKVTIKNGEITCNWIKLIYL
jgi:Icc-related predicted phosphoesterase